MYYALLTYSYARTEIADIPRISILLLILLYFYYYLKFRIHTNINVK